MKNLPKSKLVLDKKVIALLDQKKLQHVLANDKSGNDNVTADFGFVTTVSYTSPYCRPM